MKFWIYCKAYHPFITSKPVKLQFYCYTLLYHFSESVWEPPTEGFLSVAEQEAEEKKKKDKTYSKKKAPPTTGSKVKRKKTEKDDVGDDEVDEDGGEPAPVRGEFEPFMAETTRIGSWRAVEKA